MTGKVIAWLFGTAMGRGVLLGLTLAIGVAGSWFLFAKHYDGEGYARCKAEQQAALNKANAEQAAENERKSLLGSEIAKDASEKAEGVVARADDDRTSTNEEITDVYEKPPATAPVAFGSCVHPVDPRVQSRIDDAVREANAAGGSL